MAAFTTDPSTEDKMRAVFDEFDSTKSRRLTAAAFAAGLEALGVRLGAGIPEAMHRKADERQQGALNVVEFQKWGADFPTLMDCLYYRAKDRWAVVRMEEELSTSEMEARKAHEAVDFVQREVDVAEDQMKESERTYLGRQNELEEARGDEKEKKELVAHAAAATEQSRRVSTDQAAALALARDREAERGAALHTAQEGVEAAAKRLEVQSNALRGAEDRLVEIQRLLEEQRRVVAQHKHTVDELTIDLQGAEGAAADAMAAQSSAAAHSGEQADHLSACERNVQEHISMENTAQHAAREAAMDVSNAETRCQQAARALNLKRNVHDQRQRDLQAAQDSMQAAEGKRERLHRERGTFLEKRDEINAEEMPLIEREVVLFNERTSLEAQEAQLVSDFCGVTRRDVLLPQHVAALPPKRAIQEISGASPRRARDGAQSPGRIEDAAAADGVKAAPAPEVETERGHATPPRVGRPGSSTNPMPVKAAKTPTQLSPPVSNARTLSPPSARVATKLPTPQPQAELDVGAPGMSYAGGAGPLPPAGAAYASTSSATGGSPPSAVSTATVPSHAPVVVQHHSQQSFHLPAPLNSPGSAQTYRPAVPAPPGVELAQHSPGGYHPVRSVNVPTSPYAYPPPVNTITASPHTLAAGHGAAHPYGALARTASPPLHHPPAYHAPAPAPALYASPSAQGSPHDAAFTPASSSVFRTATQPLASRPVGGTILAMGSPAGEGRRTVSPQRTRAIGCI